MNYRHAFHAGNFADVVKHVVLARVVAHLRDKPAAFRVIDTHGGAGLTDLTGPEASRTGEWRNGIARLLHASFGAEIRALLSPYIDAVNSFNPSGRLVAYPGSPLLAKAWLRSQDRLVACELEANAAAALERHLKGDRRAKAVRIDGWTALTAYVPPKERRGVVLVDPPFEKPGEFARLAAETVAAHRKWSTGTFLLWYPVKDGTEVQRFVTRMRQTAIPGMLRVELAVSAQHEENRMFGSGLLVINPPWKLDAELSLMLPAMSAALRRDAGDGFSVDWLTHEK
jgi:23S rRNA (adenine2030-N6)-methyltransferase